MPITASERRPRATDAMERITSVAELRDRLADARGDRSERIGFVPTMGALHDGHLRLLERAREESELLVASIFVNPLQFGPGEDFSRYPRDPDGDAAKARQAGVDVLFTPDERELYPEQPRVMIDPGALAQRWEGAVRPGHFAGVLTVVLKLLNVVQPDVTVFGQKDFQQAALVGAMLRDLNLPVRLIVEPTVRESDGLALSSRNRYLSADDRREAVRLPRALDLVLAAYRDGTRDSASLLGPSRLLLGQSSGIAVDYLDVVDPRSLEPRGRAEEGDAVLLAARVGGTRLLDNVLLREA